MEKKDKYQAAEDEDDKLTEIDKIDEDIEKPHKKEKEFSQSIETEEYDILPNFDKHEELKDELAQKDGVELTYSFTGSEVEEALTLYQAATLMKKNLIYSLILLAVFFMYAVNIIKNPGDAFSMFLATLCVAVLAFIWISPKMHINKTKKAADLHKMEFSMIVYDTCIKIGEENASYIVTYDKEITEIFETANLYLICAGKERLFILPKRCVTPDKEAIIKPIFQTAMGKKYIVK